MTYPKFSSIQELAESPSSNIIGRRWAGHWIDLLVWCILIIPVAISDGKSLPIWMELVLLAWKKFLPIWIVLTFVFFPFAEWKWGRTPGKFVTGTVVVNSSGGHPNLTQVIIRSILCIVELNVVSGGLIAGIVASCSKRHQRLGDMAAGTYVLLIEDVKRFNAAKRLDRARQNRN